MRFVSTLELKSMIVLTGLLFILVIIAGLTGRLDEVWERLLQSFNNIAGRI